MNEILSYDQYAEIERRGFTVPYVVEIEHLNHKLVFYGSEHTNDIAHPQFDDIEERWNTFIADAISPIALVEGHFDQVTFADTKSKAQSIVEGGRLSFLSILLERIVLKSHLLNQTENWKQTS